jgi:hypothetical protein
MTRNASTRHFTLRTRILLPVALAVSTGALAGPAQAVPAPGTAASSTTAAAESSTSECASAAQDIARLRANLTALHGNDYRATIACDGTHGITVQRGSFAGRVTEKG